MTTTAKNMAPAVRAAVKNTISTNINAMLTTVWANWSSFDTATGIAVPMATPANVYNGYRGIIPDYPSIVVVSTHGKSLGNAANQGNAGWQQWDHVLEVAIVNTSDDVYVLEQQVDRYLVAVWEILMQNQGLDGSLSGLAGLDPVTYGRSQIYKHDIPNMMVMAAGLEIIVHVDDPV